MSIFGYLISLAVVGLIIGALGRLVIPGPNRIGLWATLVIGLSGAIFGGLLGGFIGLGAISIVLEVAISAGLVYLMSGRQHGRALSSRPRPWR